MEIRILINGNKDIEYWLMEMRILIGGNGMCVCGLKETEWTENDGKDPNPVYGWKLSSINAGFPGGQGDGSENTETGLGLCWILQDIVKLFRYIPNID